MRETSTDFTDDQIKAFDNDGILYILANPLLGEEPIFDRGGNFLRMEPMYNITLMKDKNWVGTKWNDGKFVATVKLPELRVLRPDLCFRIKPEGIVEGS